MKTYPATNNTTDKFIGIVERDGIFTAMTSTRSKEYKTFKGAVKFFNGSCYEGKISEVATEDESQAKDEPQEVELAVAEEKTNIVEFKTSGKTNPGYITVQIKSIMFRVSWVDQQGKQLINDFVSGEIEAIDLMNYGGILGFDVITYEAIA